MATSRFPNPFMQSGADKGIIGQVSGRANDIIQIITGSQSAIILSGASRIGKTTLVRYLCNRHKDGYWPWREELKQLGVADFLMLEDIYFVQIHIKPLNDQNVANIMKNPETLLVPFIQECYHAISDALLPTSDIASTYTNMSHIPGITQQEYSLQEWYDMLHSLLFENDEKRKRFFVVLDALDRLALSQLEFSGIAKTTAETKSEQGLAVLDKAGVIRLLVDLIDTHGNFGAILSLESLPRTRKTEQLSQVSADLARFAFTMLQILPIEEAQRILSQPPEAFGEKWASDFRKLREQISPNATLTIAPEEQIFTRSEQAWLLEQAGTHPYLLQQCSLQLFYYKQEYSNASLETKDTIAGRSVIINADSSQQQQQYLKVLKEAMNESFSAFFSSLWKSLQEALNHSSAETRMQFYEFVEFLHMRTMDKTLPLNQWTRWNTETRYLLYSEGIVRYEVFKMIHLPGQLLRDYLIQQVKMASADQAKGYWVTIDRPSSQQEQVSLSELEYRLLKTLLQSPKRCSEDELMKGAWGQVTERSTLMQRIYHLRKKLRERIESQDLIVNHYGGQYSLTHPEWLHLD